MIKNSIREIRVVIAQALARVVLKKYKPFVIAVTGSVGKTSTKDTIYTALKDSLSVQKNVKSFNGDLGTPLTILGRTDAKNTVMAWIKNFWAGITLIIFRKSYPKYLILEIGLGKPGEIRRIASWLRPHIVVVTRLSKTPVHVEFFKSVKELVDEKGSLVDAMRSDGTVILNSDDPDVAGFYTRTKATPIFYGQSEKASLRAVNYKIKYDNNAKPLGVDFEILYGDTKTPLFIERTLGKQHIYPVLAALSVGLSLSIDYKKMIDALARHDTPPGRMRLIDGINDSTIIDDTYNASPVALDEALMTLGDISTTGRKIIVIGDMKELGGLSVDAHRDAGIAAAKLANMIIGVGNESKKLIDGALTQGFDRSRTAYFSDSRSAGIYLKTQINSRDIILVKGSQSMRMEKTVMEIMKNPEKKESLLVRQEKYWERR